MDEESLRETLRRLRPDLVARQRRHARKREIALQLRRLRDLRGMSQRQLARAAGLTRARVALLESLSGPLPSLGALERYVAACGGRLTLEVSVETESEESGPA